MSKIEVNTVDVQCGSTLTLGSSGKTVQLATGASQSGFGRTGTVDWQTSSIKTSTFTAVSGQGFFVDTSSGAVTVNLPAGSAGSIVSIKDYAQSFQTNNCTVAPNGSQIIDGESSDMVLSTQGRAVTLVYADDTKGWQIVNDNETTNAEQFISAAGGNTVATCGNCKIHTFTGPGTFTVSQVASCATNNIVSHLIIAGGGGGGGDRGGGGGAGGYREVKNPVTPFTASPLDGFSTPANRVTVTAQAYPIVVGGGGAGGTQPAPSSPSGVSGNTSSFGGISSAGGGGGKIQIQVLHFQEGQVVVDQDLEKVQEVQVTLHQLLHLKVILVEHLKMVHLLQQEQVVAEQELQEEMLQHLLETHLQVELV